MICFSFLSCEKEGKTSITDQKIVGKVIDGKMTLTLDKATAIAKMESILKKENINADFDNVFLFAANDSYYMRATGGGLTSTTLLRVAEEDLDGDGDLVTIGITCTSKACASSSGCVPTKNKKQCTECGGGAGDCTKTVSAE